MTIMYNEPVYKIKNNGWLSKSHCMKRGIRQGCPMSALLFVLVVEILALMIRQSQNVKGIQVGDIDHTITQYADDATLFVRDLDSITHVFGLIESFSRVAGPKLNILKTKGIWLGPLKDLGLRKYENIVWTGNPVKCLGIYVGHNQEKCFDLNWTRRLDKVQNLLTPDKHRNLTLLSKVSVIKNHAMSKLVYPASVLDVPSSVTKRIKDMFFDFLWGKRDRIKRSVLVNDIMNGGINMLDIDKFLMSLKAVWVSRIVDKNGKWSDVFKHKLNQLGLPLDFIFKTNFKNVDSFPIIKVFPKFYQDVLLAFNNSKLNKPFNRLSTYEMLQLPLWGNVYFKILNTCLYSRNFILANVLYVKDIVNNDGVPCDDKALYDLPQNKQHILQDLYLIKNCIIKKIRTKDLSMASHIKLKPTITVLKDNKWCDISGKKSKFFYEMLVKRSRTRGHMESIYSREFGFENRRLIWERIYKQKVKNIFPIKVKEFNFKLLHNIVPCGLILSKWQPTVSKRCSLCNEIENTKHMLYKCEPIQEIWQAISRILKFQITWKNIVCGFPKYLESSKAIDEYNIIISIVTYAIFLQNSMCKFNEKANNVTGIKQRIKQLLILNEIRGGKLNLMCKLSDKM